MSVNDIINRHKKHLTNAQVHSLVKLSNEYKQLNAGRRAEAYGDLYTNHQDFRRGLQNMGLASRRGNIISGREVMGQVRVDDAYHRFNDQLNNIEDRMLDNAAGNMRAQNIARQQAAQPRNFVDNLADQIKQQYAAKKEFNENAVDPRIGNMPKPTKVQPQKTVPQVQGDIDPRFAQPVSAPDKARMARIIPQARTAQRTANVQGAVTQAFDNANRAANPAAYAALEVKYATKQKALADNTARWDREIADGDKIAKDDPEYKLYKNRAEKARREKANAQSSLYRTQLAMNLPADVGTLVAADDADFAVRYSAAEKLYKDAVENAKKAKGKSASDDQNAYAVMRWQNAEDELKNATTAFAKFEQAKAYRNMTTPMDFYARDIPVDESLVPSVPKWVRPNEWNGSNFKTAFANGWEADDYAKEHDTKGSKYAALVNDWSLVNGRTALLYSQDFQVTKGFLNVADFFTEVIGKGGTTRDSDHNRFLGECVMAYKGDYESSGTKSEKEQMDAMLTLANLMTDEERATFNTILNRSGAGAADEYFKHLYNDVLPARFSEYVHNEQKFDTRDTIGKVRQSLFSVPVNLTQGVTGVAHTMTTQQDDPVAAMIGARKYNTAQSMRDVVSEDMSEFGKFAYGTGMSMADSMTVAAISGGIGSIAEGLGASAALAGKIGSTLGGSLLGGSAFNSAYSEALDRGLSPDKARATALGQGINEMLFEAVSLDLVVSQFQHGGVLKVAKNRWVNWAVNAGVSAGVEGSEELTTDVANELWDKYINGIYSEELTKLREYIGNGMSYEDAKAQVQKEFDAQLGMSFLGGAVSGGIMGGGATFLGMLQNRDIANYGKSIRADTQKMNELTNFEYKSEEAQEILSQKVKTDEDIGMLDIIHTQELVEQAESFVDEAVADGKMPQEVADIYKKFAENGVQTEENPNGITDADAEKMMPYVDTIRNAEAIKEGLGNIVKAQQEARAEFEKLSPEEQQKKLASIQSEATSVRNAPSMRVTSKESQASAQVATAAYQSKNVAKDITIKGNKVATQRGSVTFDYDGKTSTESMTENQRRALRFCTAVANKTGVNVNVAQQFVGDQANKNGYYDPKTNTIHVNLSGTNSVVYTVSHELTHFLKEHNAQAYSDLSAEIQKQLAKDDLVGSDLPEMYQDIVGKYMTGDNTLFEALVAYEKDRYAKNDIALNQADAEEEVVARCCESFLGNEAFVQTMTQKHERSARAVARFLNELRSDVAALQGEAYQRGVQGDYYADVSPENDILSQIGDIDRVAKLWSKALNEIAGKRKPRTERVVKSKEGNYARLSHRETAQASGNIDVTADVVAEGENGEWYSLKSIDFDMRSGKMYKDLVERGVMTEKEVAEYDKFLKDLVAYIKPHREFLDMNESYNRENRPFTAFKDNSDPLYKLSLDFSTLCRKRLTTQYIIEKLQLKLKKALSAEEQLAVRAMLKDYQKIDKGLQVACGMCYVEAARYKSPKQINLWLEADGRRKAIIQYFAVGDKAFSESVKQKQAEWKVRHGYADDATKKEMSSKDVNALNKMSYDLRQAYEPNAEQQAIFDKALALPEEQFLSAANLADLAEGNEADRTIYAAYTRFIRAATRSKSLEADIPYYYGDSESRVSDTFVKNVNAENGMRFDSWSDFQFTHLLDMIVAITDLSVRGSAMHGYTKFPEFVRIFGKTGAMFNLSGVPQGIGLKADGSLDFSPTESINAEEAMKLREEFPETAGFQCIGINDRHIRALLGSDYIDYVIPYHVSGMNAKLRSIAKIAGWSDYTGVQNAKIDHSLDGNKAKCDPSVWHVEPVFSEFFVGYNTGMSGIEAMRASAQKYVDMCHERGMKPKFADFLDNDNYWKLLIDRKMINQNTGALIEQKAVKPNFDLKAIKREIDKYVDSYDQNREENAFKYIAERWDEVPALVAKLEKEGKAEKKRQKEAAKNINMLKGEMVNAMPGGTRLKVAAQKFSIAETEGRRLSVSPMSNAVSSEANTKFSIRNEAAPSKTQDVYKLMRLGKDGRLYPLFIDSAEGIVVGTWYNADSPDMSVLKTLPSGVYLIGDNGKDIVTLTDYQRTHGEKSSKFPSKAAINSAANDGKRWVFIEDVAKAQRRYGGENRKYWNLGINGSGSVSTFAMRPGWHAGSLPTMRQIGKGANKNLRDDSFVWVKGRVSADVNYQAEAAQNPDNDIPTHIPTNGFYMKATNPNAAAAQTDTVGWYIAGAFIADRIMSDSEARKVIDDWNASHPSDHVEYDWERESGGEFDAESMSIRNAKFSLKEGEERAIKIADGKTKNGETVSFIDRILDGQKTGETRTSKGSIKPNAWVGIYRDGKVYGRVKFGEPKWITKQSKEYKTSFIEGTNYDIDDSVGGKWYYPVLEVQDFRNNPIPTNRAGQWGAAYNLPKTAASIMDKEYLALANKVKDSTATDADKAELRKAVDEAAKAAGYPVHVYRGGGSVHNVFDTKRGAGTTQYGSGTYFTDAKGLAKEWAAERAGEPDKGYVGEYYVGIKKMFDDTSTIEPTQEWKNVERILKGYGVDSARIKYAQNYGFEGIAKALQSVGMISRGAFDAYSWKNAEKVNKILRDAGYDGIKGEFYDSYQYVIFDPTQAKSADLVTYDNDGNIIPLSERFNEKEEDTRYSIMDKDFRMEQKKPGSIVRTFKQNETTANVIGSSVELEGGSLLNRVRMMQNLAEEYGSVTVTATSEKEAKAFERAGAQRETDAFSDAEYGTWEFTHTENKYEKDTVYDAKQKRNFADAVLKEVGTRKNFTQDELRVFKAKLEKAFAVLHNATFGKGDQLAAWEYADKLFDSILNRYSEMSEADADMRDAILAEMPRKTDGKGRLYHEIEVTEGQMAEIKHAFGSVAAYNQALSKALGTRVYVKQTENAKTLEDVFASDSRFDATTNEGDMPGVLLNMAQETIAKRTNPLRAESQERAAAKEAMFAKAISIVGVEQTTAQKVREAVKEARAEERAKAKDKTAKAVSEARLAERMHEGAIRAQERRASAEREANIKRTAANREAKLKEITQQKMEQQKTEQLRRDVKKVALKWNQRLVKMLANPTEASHVPVQLAKEVAEFTKTLTEYLDRGTERGQLNLTKIAKAYQQAFDDQATIAEAQKENPKYDPRGQVIDKEMYDEQLVAMMNELNEVIEGKSFKDMSAYEMRMLLNTVRGVCHTVYEANRMIGTEERKAIWKVGSQMVNQMEATHVSEKMRGYLETSLDLRRIAKIFSNSDENAEFVKLVDQLNKGAIEKERVAQVLQDMFKPVTDQYGDEISKWYGKKAEWIDTGIVKNGHKIDITKGMRVSLAMHVMNSGNMNHIENGGLTIPNRELYNKGRMADAYANGELVRLNRQQIFDIISHMTEAEKAYVAVASEFFHKRTGYFVNKTSLQLLGYRKAIVDKYFPIHTDKNFTKTDFASLKMDGSIEGQGFLKERVNASNPVYLEDITSVVNRQIRGVALYAGLAVPMRNFNAVMNAAVYEDDNGVWSPRTTVKQTMTKQMGEYGAKVVQGFLTDVSEMSHVDVTPMERFAGKLATNYVKSVLLGNMKVAMKQVASYPTAAAVIPWKYLAKALVAGGRNNRMISRANVDLINQYTPLYQMRRAGQANEIASIMQRRGMEDKLPWLLGWITKMDVMTVGRLWSAAEYMVADQQKNLVKGSDAYYKAVAQVFNDTVQQTQPNFTPLQRNAALRSKNPIVRSLVLFGTQRMQNGGILLEAAYELKQSKGKSPAEIKAAKMKLGRAVASQIIQNVLLIVASLGVDALRGRMKSWQDEDKEITMESLAKGMGDTFLSNAMGSFLGGSEVYSLLSGLYKKATDQTAYDTEFTVPALDAAETLINFAQSDIPNLIKYLTGDHSDEEKMKKAKTFSFALAKAFGYATGIPLENVLKDVFKGIIPAIEDHKEWLKTGEFTPWLHQSGKLDKQKTAANYKEWTNEGFKGSTYFYWEDKMKDVTGGRKNRIPLLLESDLTNEQKAMILRMVDTSGATSEGTVVYKSNGNILIDFANPDGWEKNVK